MVSANEYLVLSFFIKNCNETYQQLYLRDTHHKDEKFVGWRMKPTMQEKSYKLGVGYGIQNTDVP